MQADFTPRFLNPREFRLTGDQLSLRLTLIPDGVSAAEFAARAAAIPLGVGYRLLGRASDSAPIFEHRASVGPALSDREIQVQLWVPPKAFETEPLRLLYVNCLVEGRYWFQDRGAPGTFLPLCHIPAGTSARSGRDRP